MKFEVEMLTIIDCNFEIGTTEPECDHLRVVLLTFFKACKPKFVFYFAGHALKKGCQ